MHIACTDIFVGALCSVPRWEKAAQASNTLAWVNASQKHGSGHHKGVYSAKSRSCRSWLVKLENSVISDKNSGRTSEATYVAHAFLTSTSLLRGKTRKRLPATWGALGPPSRQRPSRRQPSLHKPLLHETGLPFIATAHLGAHLLERTQS